MLLLFFLALLAFQPISEASNGLLFDKSLNLGKRNLQALNTTNDDDSDIHQPGNPLRFILYYANLYGQWSNSDSISQGNYFGQNTGFVVVESSSDDDLDETDSYTDTDTDSSDEFGGISDSDMLDYTDDDFLLVIFDGKATNKNYIQLNINFQNLTYFPANSSFMGTQEIDYVLGGDKTSNVSNCSAYVSISFTNLSNNAPLTSQPHVPLSETGVQFQITSSTCAISITTTVMTITSFAESALPVYLILMSLAGIISAYSAYNMLKNFPDNVEELKSMSVWSLWITSAWELFLALFHIYVAVKYFQFWVLVITFIFFFTLSMLRKINQLILIVSRVERGDTLPLNTRMMMSLIPICGLCVSYCVAAFIPKVSFLIITAGLYMIPQIYRIYRKGERPRGYYWHNFAFVFSKVFFVAYYLLYPENLFEVTTNLAVGWGFVGLIIVQMFIIMLQRHLPQCLFTLRKFMHKQKQGIMSDKNEECAICFEALAYDVEKGSNDQICETPCHHKFHRRCIEEWLNLRGNCPLDRNRLDLGDLLF